MTHAGGEELEPGPVQRPTGRSELSDDVSAVTVILEHPDDAADLPLDAAQSLDNVICGVGLESHNDQYYGYPYQYAKQRNSAQTRRFRSDSQRPTEEVELKQEEILRDDLVVGEVGGAAQR